MHFRNGAVAISYVSTLLLILVDEKKVSLDDKLSKWLPDVPHADRVTLGQLAQMTSGYVDYVIGNTEFDNGTVRKTRSGSGNPTSCWASRRPSRCSTSPGTNWNYAHTNYVLLGMALEKATGQDMPKLLAGQGASAARTDQHRELVHPGDPRTRAARVHLRAPRGPPDPQRHTVLRGVDVLESVVDDHPRRDSDHQHLRHGGHRGGHRLRASCCPTDSYEKMVSTDLRGKTHAQPGCTTCAAMNDVYTYGMGIVISGDWLLQNPLFAGEAGGRGVPAVARRSRSRSRSPTQPEAFDDQGNYSQRGRHAVPQDRRRTRPRRRATGRDSRPNATVSSHRGAARCLFIYNEHLATEALLGEAFTECGYDIDTFEVVPAERVDAPGSRRDVPRPDRLRRHRPARARGGRSTTTRCASTWVGAEMQMVRDAADAGVADARRVLRRPAARPGVRRFGRPRSPTPEIGWYDVDSDDDGADPRRAVVPVALRPLDAAAGSDRDRQDGQRVTGVRARPGAGAAVPPRARSTPCWRRGWPTTATARSRASASTRRIALGDNRSSPTDAATAHPRPGARLPRPAWRRQP